MKCWLPAFAGARRVAVHREVNPRVAGLPARPRFEREPCPKQVEESGPPSRRLSRGPSAIAGVQPCGPLFP